MPTIVPAGCATLYYCDGMVTNWGAHLNDIAQWGNRHRSHRAGGGGSDRRPTPMPTVSGTCCWSSKSQFRYANGVRLIYKIDKPYIRFEGTEGWIYADDTGKVEASKPSILAPPSGSNWIGFRRKWTSRTSSMQFARAARPWPMRKSAIEPRRCATWGILRSTQGGRLEWDPAKERFTNDKAANQYIGKPILAPRRA